MSKPFKLAWIYFGSSMSRPADEDLSEWFSNKKYHTPVLINPDSIASVQPYPLESGNILSKVFLKNRTVYYVLETLDEIHDLWVR